MLYFLFQLGEESYALALRQVQRVIPRVATRPLPLAPPEVIGLAAYHGRPLPVVDLCQRVLGRPCRERLSTRIMVVSLGTGLVGLLVESLTRVVTLTEDCFHAPGLTLATARFLGDVAQVEDSWAQRVELEELIGPELRQLFAAAG